MIRVYSLFSISIRKITSTPFRSIRSNLISGPTHLCNIIFMFIIQYCAGYWSYTTCDTHTEITVICARLLWKVFASLLQPKWFINYWANQNRIADYGQIPLIYQYWLGLGIQSFTIRGNVCKVFFVGMRMFYHSFRSNFHNF